MMRFFRNLVSQGFIRLPYFEPFYKACLLYISSLSGENNADLRTNGELRLLKNNLPSCKVVFDVGANIGTWTKLALEYNSRAAIHCFEPSKDSFRRLQDQHFPPNVFLNNAGLSDSERDATLFAFQEGASANSLYKREGFMSSKGTPESIHLTTLDAYCQRRQIDRIGFLKIDVEGHEVCVLNGAKKMFAEARIEMIQLEYGGTYIDSRYLLKDVFLLFNNLPYSFYLILPKRLRKIRDYSLLLENFQYKNFLITRNDVSLIP